MAEEEKKEQPIIVKKIKKADGHHGGAWKVAYADFVTAMMAFFLLLWLLNVSTQEELNAISNYFDPTHPKVSDSKSGAGGVMGGLSMTQQGAMATNVQNINVRPTPARPNASTQSYENEDARRGAEELRKQEEERYKTAAEQIKQEIEENPELAALSDNLMVDMTPEGLRIQIVDQKGQSMFPSGSAEMYGKTRRLMEKLTGIIKDMPNDISIRGHTDSTPYGPGADYTNWELSTDRANSSRRVLLEAGFPAGRINNVVGKADTEPLVPKDPASARNRRISIILLREELTNPSFEEKAKTTGKALPKGSGSSSGAPQIPVGTFRKTPGQVQFP